MSRISGGAPILAMVDLEHEAGAKSLAELAVAEADGADVHLAYVLAYGNYSFIGPLIPKETVALAITHAHDSMDRLAGSLNADPSPKTHILRGGVGEQTVLLAETIGAGLIMLNAKRPDAQAHGLGPHAAQVMRHAHCSVVVIR